MKERERERELTRVSRVLGRSIRVPSRERVRRSASSSTLLALFKTYMILIYLIIDLIHRFKLKHSRG